MSTLSVIDASREVPSATALIVGGDVWTFADLADRVRRRMDTLRHDQTLDDGVPFPLLGSTTLETLETLYALFDLGRPALLLHPRWTTSERAAVLDRIPHAGALPLAVGDERTLAVVHTSGTTGAPRGVVLSRRAFIASAQASARNLGWTPADRWLLALPLAHVGGLSVMTRCLLARRPVVIPSALARDERLDLEALIESIESSQVTLLSLVPTQLAWLLDRRPTWNPPAAVRVILLGGAPASPRRLSEALDRDWPVLTTYGLTEACSQVSTLPIGASHRGLLGAGLPLDEIEVRIARGVIEVRGPTLLSGYYPPPPAMSPMDATQWLSTGDSGFFDDAGCLHVLGRGTELIVTGGENVHPSEVETVLECVPGVVSACVFGVEDDTWGHVVAAALVVEGSAEFVETALVEITRTSLAPFKRPRRYAVIDAVVVGPTGKMDRAETARKAEGRLMLLHGV